MGGKARRAIERRPGPRRLGSSWLAPIVASVALGVAVSLGFPPPDAVFTPLAMLPAETAAPEAVPDATTNQDAGISLPEATSPGCTGGALSIVAHTDDDLLFMNPSLMRLIGSNTCVYSVYVTAGDAGRSADYWQSRERGAMAAYAHMAAVADDWSTNQITTHALRMLTLKANPHIHLVFMRLPDGMQRGQGVQSTRFVSLTKLWTGVITTITAVDGSATYSRDQIVATLGDLMHITQPTVIRTLDYVGNYRDTDHADHHTVAYFTREASTRYTAHHTLIAYQGYPIASRKANVSASDARAKLETFNIYAKYDAVAQNRTYITREYIRDQTRT